MSGPDATGWRAPAALVALATAMAVVLGVLALHIHQYRPFSPIDELQHLDYAVRAADGELVRRGDLVTQPVLREQACRGLDADFELDAACDDLVMDPAVFQEAGFNTAYIHSPAYYAITGTGARAVRAVTPADGLLTSTRLAGLAWSVAAVLALWWLFSLVGVTHVVGAGLAVSVLLAPAVVHQMATVNSDQPSLAAGAVLAAMALLVERRRLHPGWFALVAAVVVGTKATNLVGVMAALGYLLVRADQQRRLRVAAADVDPPGGGPARDSWLVAGRQVVGVVGATVAAVGVAVVAWIAVKQSIALVPEREIPISARYWRDNFPLRELFPAVRDGLSPLQGPMIPRVYDTVAMRALVTVGDVGLLVGAVWAVAYAPAASRLRAMAVAGLLACAAMGPYVVAANWLGNHFYLPPANRYAISAVPMVVAAVALTLDRRGWRWVPVATGAGSAVIVVGSILV